jgi:glycerol-3-phosphate acyltransferase PlsY
VADVSAWYLVPLSLLLAYLVGSIPFAYIIVKAVTGEDVTQHGTGNVGAMNVRRSTGSWGWFVVAMLADGFKGLIPVAAAKTLLFKAPALLLVPTGEIWEMGQEFHVVAAMSMAAVAGCVFGHNYSCWMALIKRHLARTGKGLATGAGALLAYDWRYFVAVVVVGLLVIAITRYMMAGQVAAALSLPLYAIATGQPDWPFALLMGLVVYSAHHRRFVGLLRGKEPKLYTGDTGGPRG